ncbi:hypothetical protein Q0812_08080 [Brevundimonas sp. 2R-24]|uniref:Uncharacterized protein n=1 Tax=Peiella sedimenti TaxID=3061083 RepID=A0ABT8SMN5_9CAUL|nr:hypothetical protein [Caulobacteraceae bacterium XZ-24]
MKSKPPENPFEAAREAARRRALRALKRAKKVAAQTGVELSEWEDEFLGSVSERVETYGRAFADPDKGAMGAPLSAMQGQKLKEISAKAKGQPLKPRWGRRKPVGGA